ncbi:MAG TPA: hypothetical protein VIY53_04665 [Acidobacteriaceae bacterium]
MTCPHSVTLAQFVPVLIESAALVQQAVKTARAAGGGFANHLAAQVGLASGATQVLTFDKNSREPRKSVAWNNPLPRLADR